MGSYTWYVSCSPRSPEKIAPELTALADLDGVLWRERDASGSLVNQIRFANLLKGLTTFEGSISIRTPDFSARDRFAPMQTFGFAYVNSEGILKITPAGRRLIEGKRTQELFLKQFLKWQYPSWQHGGNPTTKSRYPVLEMNIFPFVETLRACHKLGSLKKEEIAIFLLPTINGAFVSEAIGRIQAFREGQAKLTGRERLEFISNVHYEQFKMVYSEPIRGGRITTREGSKKTVNDFLKTKIRNSLDVSDAAIRYFRATGLFTLSSDYRGIVISPMHKKEVEKILSEMEYSIIEYDNVDQFYQYMGNPDLPVFPWETAVELRKKAVNLGLDQTVARTLQQIDLKDYIEERQRHEKEYKLKRYMEEAQKEDMVQDIIQMFSRILDRDVVDPALFFEWNTWRALVSINDFKTATPNFVIDDDLKPFSFAPGNKPDFEIEYNNTFIVLTEVTLSGGARQYDTEGEPVTRHIGRYQKKESEKGNPRAVYGLFIAPSINPATSHYFYVHLKSVNNPEFGGYLNIVPLTLAQFITIFRFIKSLQFFNRNIIRDLLDRIIALKDVTENGREWVQSIPKVIGEWEEKWSAYEIA